MSNGWGNDITMCNGIGCNLKFGCYRFKAIPNEHWQAYFTETPVTNVGGVSLCEYFWPTEEFNKINNDRKTDRGELEQSSE